MSLYKITARVGMNTDDGFNESMMATEHIDAETIEEACSIMRDTWISNPNDFCQIKNATVVSYRVLRKNGKEKK